MSERRVVVGAGVGLHARPAALLVKAATAQPVPVSIGKDGGEQVDTRSILSVIGLNARGGDEVVLRAEGPDAERALDELAAIVTAEHGG
ncbi:HPr family phosphocarrier protein [Amycolatopsis palatopharyngis]|uniref:HPr family phosphocarrier protein n=1 Tax=Amycolatopsis palatopharyngis TaxID=187982 RepID=UPI000E225CF5|nr:HPr family phosphocarrier protein [Amycolatopsis palatopharyngis]